MRFDDHFKWKIVELIAVPIIAAALTGAVIWGSTKERISDLETLKPVIAQDHVDVSILKSAVADMSEDVKYIRRHTK